MAHQLDYKIHGDDMQAVEIALGKGSGIANIEEHLEKRGRRATAEQGNELLRRVKQLSTRKKALLSEEEFDEIVNEVLGSS